MVNETWGAQMLAAISAVRQLHSDSSRLLLGLDRFMIGYKPVYGSFATADLTYDIKRGVYMAEGLLRHWVHFKTPNEVIAVNIAYFDLGSPVDAPMFPEPLFIVAKMVYEKPLAITADRTKSWDPWSAYLVWNEGKKSDDVIEAKVPAKRIDLLKVAVKSVPLFTMDGELAAQRVVQQVRDFEFST